MPADRRVSVRLNGRTVAASRRAMLLRDSEVSLHYFFPLDDVDMSLLAETDHSTHSGHRGDTKHWTVAADGATAQNAAWTYSGARNGRPDTSGYLTFDWQAMDAWYEETEQVFVHPRDPFHRVDTMHSERHIRVDVGGVTVADTRRPVVLFETGLPVRFYLPPEDVRIELLMPTDLVTSCPYKGDASYWSVEAAGETFDNYVWGYQDPIAEIPKIKGLLSFFNEKLDIYEDGVLLDRPQTYWS